MEKVEKSCQFLQEKRRNITKLLTEIKKDFHFRHTCVIMAKSSTIFTFLTVDMIFLKKITNTFLK